MDLQRNGAQLPTGIRPGGAASPYSASARTPPLSQPVQAAPGVTYGNVPVGQENATQPFFGLTGANNSWQQYTPDPTGTTRPPPRTGGLHPMRDPAAPEPDKPPEPTDTGGGLGQPSTGSPYGQPAGNAGSGPNAGSEDNVSGSSSPTGWTAQAAQTPFGNGGTGSYGGGCGRLFGKIFRAN